MLLVHTLKNDPRERQKSPNFVIEPLSTDGKAGSSLVNAIGQYAGTVLLNGDGAGVAALKVTADGAWTLAVTPLGLLRQWSGTDKLTGHGDDVFRVAAGSLGSLSSVHITHHGEANFVVSPYGAALSGSSVVNEIGNYDGEVQLGRDTVLITVLADGDWTVVKT